MLLTTWLLACLNRFIETKLCLYILRYNYILLIKLKFSRPLLTIDLFRFAFRQLVLLQFIVYYLVVSLELSLRALQYSTESPMSLLYYIAKDDYKN